MGIAAFLTGQVAKTLVAIIYPLLAARKDSQQITANGSLDTLKKAFHSVNVWIRALVFVGLGIAVDGVLMLISKPVYSAAIFLSYEVFTVFSFWFIFDKKLNRFLGRSKYYVGQNANTDKFLGKFSEKQAFNLKLALFIASSLLYLIAVVLWVKQQ